jgi:hypothetical protein
MPPAVPRRPLTLAAAASLLLFVATVALWVRSYWRLDVIDHIRIVNETVRRFEVGSLNGTFELSSKREPVPLGGEGLAFVAGYRYGSSNYESPPQPRPRDVAKFFASAGASTRWFLGFGFVIFEPANGSSARYIWLPHWSLALSFAILPVLRMRAVIRSRKFGRVGRCTACGYDLRATPDRCPECGVPASAVGFAPP